MTSVIKHELRGGAGMFGSFNPEGWNPKLKVVLRGPSPAGAELVWTVRKPDGSAWFEHRQPAPALDEGAMSAVELQRWEEGTDIDEGGTVAFTLRLVSELDGVDELLHDGSMSVVALGDHRYAVDNSWLHVAAWVCLDTVEEYDAPKLKVTTFHQGEVGAYQLEAHCFHEGKRIAHASYVEGRHSFVANDGQIVGLEARAEFDDVRGWNNLADEGWGSDEWHLLDAHDGRYEVKFVREYKVVRVVPFEVAGGRLVAQGPVEADPWTGPVMLVDAVVQGDFDGEQGDTALFYGDGGSAVAWASIDDVYALRADPSNQEAVPFDDATMSALQEWLSRAERLVRSWERDMIDAVPPHDPEFVVHAEVVVWEINGLRRLREFADVVPDSHEVQHGGETTTLGELTARVQRIAAAAQAVIDGSNRANEDALAPYRAVLAHDKLRIFEDHPVTGFQYLTTHGVVIEAPEELASAEYWYFEGMTDVSVATVDGVEVKVKGWRVLGWQFDPDGRVVDEWEHQGQGANAPKNAFQGR